MQCSSDRSRALFSDNSIANGSGLANKKIIIFLCSLLFLAALPIGCGIRRPLQITATDTAMGTVVRMTLYADPGEGLTVSEEELIEWQQTLLREVCRLDTEVLSWRLESSELYQVQEGGRAQNGAPISRELEEILLGCEEVSGRSQGAFTVSIGALTRLWRMDERAAAFSEEELPGPAQIQEALGRVGAKNVQVRDGKLTLEPGTFLDFGAVGKGAALDHIRDLLDGQARAKEGARCSGGVFALGGSILTYGRKPDGSAWKVAVVDPRDAESTIGYLELEGSWCVSTSGDYERFFEKDGVRYHHLLDPKTGYPAGSGVRSVTILSESGFLSDALSTACFVLGKEKGMALAQEYGAGIILVEADGEIVCNGVAQAYFHQAGETGSQKETWPGGET